MFPKFDVLQLWARYVPWCRAPPLINGRKQHVGQTPSKYREQLQRTLSENMNKFTFRRLL